MKNTTNENFFTDDQLLAILDAKEAGKSFPDALLASGLTGLNEAQTHELRAYWDMHGDLMQGAHHIAPSMDLLTRIASGLESKAQTVTVPSGSGYQGGDGQIIRTNNYLHHFMHMNWKIAAPIAVVALVLTALVGMGGEKPDQLAMNQEAPADSGGAPMAMMATKMAAPVEVSGNIDELAASLTAEADADGSLLDSASDSSLVTADSQSITDINTAYDETTF